MRRFLKLPRLLALLALGASQAAAAGPVPLQFNGEAVDFAFWAPEPAAYDYDQVALSLGKPSRDAARMAVSRALLRLAREMGRE